MTARTTKPSTAGTARAGGPLAPCGTVTAYKRHLRRQEVPDDACLAANAAQSARARVTAKARRAAA